MPTDQTAVHAGHYCPDWDYAFIRPDDPEMECCGCFTPPPDRRCAGCKKISWNVGNSYCPECGEPWVRVPVPEPITEMETEND